MDLFSLVPHFALPGPIRKAISLVWQKDLPTNSMGGLQLNLIRLPSQLMEFNRFVKKNTVEYRQYIFTNRVHLPDYYSTSLI